MTFSASIPILLGGMAFHEPGAPRARLEVPGQLEEAADLVVRLPEAVAQGSAEGPEDLGGQLGALVQEGGEGGLADDQEGGVPVRHRGGGAGEGINERHFAAG